MYIIVALYVDDLFMIETSSSIRVEFKLLCMSDRVEIYDIGNLTYYIGI